MPAMLPSVISYQRASVKTNTFFILPLITTTDTKTISFWGQVLWDMTKAASANATKFKYVSRISAPVEITYQLHIKSFVARENAAGTNCIRGWIDPSTIPLPRYEPGVFNPPATTANAPVQK
jgi:hypothetical protein